MKMTRLEWTYLQRIALDHPYFDTHKLPLTEKEAKAIVEANNTMTGREFVDSIYAKLGMTRPQEEKKRLSWLRSLGELFTVPPIRKIAIAVLVVVLMTVFFAATPTGRAIAESVIQYIVTLFEDGSLTVNQHDSDAMITSSDKESVSVGDDWQEADNSIVYVNTFEEFTTATGVQPVVLPFPHTELYYYYDEYTSFLKLNTIYKTSTGMITTYQIWNTDVLSASTSTGFTTYDADSSVCYSLEENGMTTVMKLYDDSIMGIIFDDSYTVDSIISLFADE